MSEEPRPAATVVVVRDAAGGLEVLLLERARRAARPEPAAWVFPGGRIEAEDRAERGAPVEEHARRAAVREAREEAGLELHAPSLVPISRWITPEIAARRFDTWFFLGAVAAEAEVRVDGVEIATHRWLAPASALEAHQRGEIRLAPPTFVTVCWLAEHPAAGAALDSLARAETLVFRPRICPQEGGACILYPGDAGYESGDPARPGPRHRLWALPEGYRYERSRGT